MKRIPITFWFFHPATIAYNDFDLTDVGSVTLGTAQTNIGATWRVTGGPGGSQPAVYEDRYYIIKDLGGNYYKLKFTALTQGGERGKPQISYELLDQYSNVNLTIEPRHAPIQIK